MISENERKLEIFKDEALVHMDALYNSALKLTYNEDDSRDLVQETFYKAYRFFDQFNHGTNCKAWLYRILKNTLINKYRKKSNSVKHVDFNTVEPFLDTIVDKQEFAETYDENTYKHSVSDEVDAALSRLPFNFRMVLVLSDIEGFSYKEIADIMGCPVGTIRSRLSRARKLMYRYLQGYARKNGYIDSEKSDFEEIEADESIY